MKERSVFINIGVPLICLLLLWVASWLIFDILIQPSVKTITKNYFEAVMTGDMTRALRYTSNSVTSRYGLIDCRKLMEEYSRLQIATYRGAELRNIEITTRGPGGSWDEVYWGIVDFEYRLPSNVDWFKDQIVLQTIYDDHGVRYACGGIG